MRQVGARLKPREGKEPVQGHTGPSARRLLPRPHRLLPSDFSGSSPQAELPKEHRTDFRQQENEASRTELCVDATARSGC